jgi:predicted acetyltransferase
MPLSIDPAGPDERHIIANLLQFYLYDFSEFDDEEGDTDPRGRFPDYPGLDDYWRLPDWHPFLFRVDGQLAGFALVCALARPSSERSWGMAEFFVMRRYRRMGYGRQAAVAIFDQLPGRWEIGELHANTGAIAFWRRVIAEYTTGRYSEIGTDDPSVRGPFQIFRTPGAS